MAEGSKTPASHGKEKRSTTLLLIALFKLTKCVLLVIVGIGAIRLIHRDMADAVEHWVEVLRVDPDNHFIHRIIAKLLAVTPKQLEALSIGTFFYAALLLTEGVGLLLRKYWAEYFTVITTALFVPLELFEIAKHVSVTRIVVLLLNVAIVVYLINRIRSHKRAESEADGREGAEAPQEA
jgi:uncharacterized membrane protein (DUF2068 family)